MGEVKRVMFTTCTAVGVDEHAPQHWRNSHVQRNSLRSCPNFASHQNRRSFRQFKTFSHHTSL